MRLAIFVLCLLALAGCQMSDRGAGGLGFLATDTPSAGIERGAERGALRAAPDTIRVARGQITVGGPEGYCVDRRASKRGGPAAFVLLASCASLTGSANANAPAAPGLLTALVDARAGGDLPPPDSFQAFFATEGGRAALARDGQARSVEVLEAALHQDALIMKIRDSSPVTTPGLEGTYWRGLFVLNGRLITLTVNAFEVRPLGTDAGRAKMRDFIARIQALSSAG